MPVWWRCGLRCSMVTSAWHASAQFRSEADSNQYHFITKHQSNDVIGRAISLLLEWGNYIYKIWGLSTSEERFEETSTSRLSIIGRSHIICICRNSGNDNGTSEKLTHEVEVSHTSSSGSLTSHVVWREIWSDNVNVAEAIKAEGASFTALMIPKPPALTGRRTCKDWTSHRSIFKIFGRPIFESCIKFRQPRVTTVWQSG